MRDVREYKGWAAASSVIFILHLIIISFHQQPCMLGVVLAFFLSFYVAIDCVSSPLTLSKKFHSASIEISIFLILSTFSSFSLTHSSRDFLIKKRRILKFWIIFFLLRHRHTPLEAL